MIVFLLNSINRLTELLPSISMFNGSSYTIERAFQIALSVFSTILSIAVIAIPVGYVAQSAHNLIKAESAILPEWDSMYFEYFKKGLGIFFINLAYLFLLFFIISIPAIIDKIIVLFFPSNLIITIINIFLITVLVLPAIAGYILIIPFANISYADDFDFWDAFNPEIIISEIFQNFSDYLLILFISIILFAILPAILLFLACTCVGILAPPFIMFYMVLVIANMYSQLYKQVKYPDLSIK